MLRHFESTFCYCHTYICAFTSNYPGWGNPVRRRTASTGEDQRTRYSKLLHSLVVSVVVTMLLGPARRGIIHVYVVPRLCWNFGQLPNAHLCSTSVATQLRTIIVTIPFPYLPHIFSPLYLNFRFRFSVTRVNKSSWYCLCIVVGMF